MTSSDTTGKSFQFVIPEEHSGERLDKVLTAHPEIISRSHAAQLIQAQCVDLDGKPVKASLKVETGQRFNITLPTQKPSSDLQPYAIELEIVHEDEDLLVVNKPAGLVVHPAAGHTQDTLVNALIYAKKNLSSGFKDDRPGIVHRLDRDTSGLLIVSKNDFSHNALAQQFQKKTIHRIYWALVFGTPKQLHGCIQTSLIRHPHDRKRFCSDKQNISPQPDSEFNRGKWAITHYKTQRTFANGISLIHCQLETGRTHQIRVHLSELGHPILADDLYGGVQRAKNLKSVKLRQLIQRLPRIALHAAELGLTHPRTGEVLKFQRGWPKDMDALLAQMKAEDELYS